MTDKVMTLHELCDSFGISRRTIQGYEKRGLVKATGRNMRGYLLYDPHMQAEILRVRRLQKFGFPVKEIKTLLLLPKDFLPCGRTYSSKRRDLFCSSHGEQ